MERSSVVSVGPKNESESQPYLPGGPNAQYRKLIERRGGMGTKNSSQSELVKELNKYGAEEGIDLRNKNSHHRGLSDLQASIV